MVDFEVGVVLPAAGCGERMGSSVPKQYIKILVISYKTLLFYVFLKNLPTFLFVYFSYFVIINILPCLLHEYTLIQGIVLILCFF